MWSDIPYSVQMLLLALAAGFVVFAIILMVVLFEMAQEATKFFQRENQRNQDWPGER